MDAPYFAGSVAELGQLLRDADVSLCEIEDVYGQSYSCIDQSGVSVFAAGRVAELFKAIEKGDRAAADTLLCRWGVRR